MPSRRQGASRSGRLAGAAAAAGAAALAGAATVVGAEPAAVVPVAPLVTPLDAPADAASAARAAGNTAAMSGKEKTALRMESVPGLVSIQIREGTPAPLFAMPEVQPSAVPPRRFQAR